MRPRAAPRIARVHRSKTRLRSRPLRAAPAWPHRRHAAVARAPGVRGGLFVEIACKMRPPPRTLYSTRGSVYHSFSRVETSTSAAGCVTSSVSDARGGAEGGRGGNERRWLAHHWCRKECGTSKACHKPCSAELRRPTTACEEYFCGPKPGSPPPAQPRSDSCGE